MSEGQAWFILRSCKSFGGKHIEIPRFIQFQQITEKHSARASAEQESEIATTIKIAGSFASMGQGFQDPRKLARRVLLPPPGGGTISAHAMGACNPGTGAD